MPPLSPVKILFVGDMHLGRRATRLPTEVQDDGGPAQRDVGPLATLHRTVQLACTEQVQAVAFAGDLVHKGQNLFEARGQLQEALGPLREAGIAIVAVAGNHDTGIMPLLADAVAGLRLLGPDGTWDSYEITPGVKLVGWSFPSPHYADSPLLQAPPQPVPGVVTIGLLHADRDASGSRYAPVTSDELMAVGYDAWALGHVHAPDPVPGPGATARPFYLGSVGAVPPNEVDFHGPVLATIEREGTVRWERCPLAPLRWEHVDLSVADLSPERAATDPVDALRAHLFIYIKSLRPASDPRFPLLALGLRITLTGNHPEAHALLAALKKLKRHELITKADDCWVFIDKITSSISVPIDLAEAARNPDPPGLLARRILDLEQETPAAAGMVRQARLRFAEVPLPHEFAEKPLDDEAIRRYLIRAGRQALNALLAQQAGGAS